jgi:hypothetical protein
LFSQSLSFFELSSINDIVVNRCNKNFFGDIISGAQCFCRKGRVRFEAGQGFDLNEAPCIKPESYSILIEARLDTTSGPRQILGSATWGSDGIFVDNKFQILPKSIGIECAATIFPSKFYQFGIVHTKDGEVSLYLDGYQCATGSPKENKGFVLDANDVYFLHSDTGKHSAGYVNRIRLWDHALTNKEMASASGCSLTQEGFTSTCDDPPAVFVPLYSKYKYSSVYSNNDVGTGYGRGRLDSPQV